MTLDAIRCLCAIIDSGSFRAAAERVHRSQPAVTQQIKALERELGQSLLDRKTCTPTPAGKVVYDNGRQLLQGAENIQREVSDFDELATGELNVGTSDTNALYFLPRFAGAFAQAMPKTRLVIQCRSSDAIADDVQRGNLDLGIVTLPMQRPELQTQSLFEQRLVLVAPNSHPLAQQSRTSLARIRNEPFILIHQGTRTGTQLNEFFTQQNFTPHTIMDSGSFEVIKQYVAEGLGMSFIPEMALRPHDHERISALNVPNLPHVGIGIVRRTNAYQSAAAKRFIQIITAKTSQQLKKPAPMR